MTRVLSADAVGARDEAAAVLRAGGLVAVPTETVYGLAADAASTAGVSAVFAAKGRPAHNPLIVHVNDVAMAGTIGDLGADGNALAEAFWPGPLTLVAPRRPGARIAEAALAGGDTVALRVPAAPFMRDLISAVGPLVAPSANRSGRVSATSAAAVLEELGGRVPLVIDGGPSAIGLESTVVDVRHHPQILRPGAIGPQEIERICGRLRTLPMPQDTQTLLSPGLLASHYAPRAALRLDVAAPAVRPGEGWLALGNEESAAGEAYTVRLSLSGNLQEAARHLYGGLRALDRAGVGVIAVSPIPAVGIGVAIRDRLNRAAAPRPATQSTARTSPSPQDA